VPEVKREPLPQFNPQVSYLSDSQDNLAWAVFGELNFDITPRLEGSLALRYDRDDRENTTETPQQFIPGPLQGIAFTGQVRKESWDDLQPKATLRFKPSDDTSLYVDTAAASAAAASTRRASVPPSPRFPASKICSIRRPPTPLKRV
jgi:outer membrane receptor protein involved in Fe transport